MGAAEDRLSTQRHGEVLRRLDAMLVKQTEMNGKVGVNRERIVRLETHQQRSRDDRRAADDEPRRRVRPELQWAAYGGLGVPGILYVLQKLAEAVTTLADRIPIGP